MNREALIAQIEEEIAKTQDEEKKARLQGVLDHLKAS